MGITAKAHANGCRGVVGFTCGADVASHLIPSQFHQENEKRFNQMLTKISPKIDQNIAKKKSKITPKYHQKFTKSSPKVD